MALIYDFNFGPAADGLEAVVTDAYTAVEVEGSPLTLGSGGSGQLPLTEGSYQATVDGVRHMSINGVLNISASIEAAMLAPEAP